MNLSANGANGAEDPLSGVTTANSRVLFDKIAQVCTGFTTEDVTQAAINLLINAVRQNRPTRTGAATLYDEIAGKGRHVLLEHHYDATGKRLNIFPSHQVVAPGLVINPSKVRGL